MFYEPTLKDLGILGMILVYVVERGFTWLSKYNLIGPGADKRRDPRDPTAAGEKSVEFWQLEYQQRFDRGLRAMREQMVPFMDVLMRIEAQHTQIMRQHEEITALIKTIRRDQRNKRDSDEL